MARILPTDWNTTDPTGPVGRQLATLALFEKGLPDHLTVFHGVHWSRNGGGLTNLGDIDFVVLAPSGRLLLIEQKAGFLNETERGLVKRYRGAVERVKVQVDRTVDELSARLSALRHGEPVGLGYLMYCPDYTVRDRSTAGLLPEQIVDSPQREELCRRIIKLMGSEPARADLNRRIQRFFSNELELVPDASALVGRAQALITRMSEGLATWARRFEVQPMQLRVQATAGSGKTQLALALLQDASHAGRSALYVCYNRPLADHIRAAAPPNVLVFNYHQWCQHRLRNAGQSFQVAGGQGFAQLETDAQRLAVACEETVDLLIIDEGQDFLPAWRDDLLRLTGPVLAGRPAQQWWLEDPMQNLYSREASAPPGWPLLRAQVNYRSPRAVVAYVNRVLKCDPVIAGAGPVQGVEPEMLVYTDELSLVSQTKQAITLALRAGFRRQDIALISFSGRQRSLLHATSRLGPHQLRTFTGKYDMFGNPEFADGDILLDTVYRFKGQSAPCLILTEIDFDDFDELAQRKLFVGLTRASLHLILVLSSRAAPILAPSSALDGTRSIKAR